MTILQEDQTGDYLIARSEYVPGLLVELAAALEGRLPKKDSFPYLIECAQNANIRASHEPCAVVWLARLSHADALTSCAKVAIYMKHKLCVHIFLCVHVKELKRSRKMSVIRFVGVRGGYKTH